MKSYTEMLKFDTLIDRFEYLKLDGKVGEETFGSNRYWNQLFYSSDLWKKDIRPKIILRDNGCELGLLDYPIKGSIYIHHIEPITLDDILYITPRLVDLDNLISMSFNTHKAIHYGDASLLVDTPPERRPFDTCPWRH